MLRTRMMYVLPDLKLRKLNFLITLNELLLCPLCRASRNFFMYIILHLMAWFGLYMFRYVHPHWPVHLSLPQVQSQCFNQTYGNVSVGVTSLNCLYPPWAFTNPKSSRVGLQTIEVCSHGRRWKCDTFDTGINPFPDVYWVLSTPQPNLGCNWTAVHAIAVLAQQVYIAPVITDML